MDIKALVRSRIPVEILSDTESQVAIVIVPLSKNALPQIEHYPGKLPFYHFGVKINNYIYEFIGKNVTTKENGTHRYRLIENLIESSFDTYSEVIDQCQFIYLHDNIAPHILHRFHQIVELKDDEDLKKISLDLKPYYDLMWCNCEHLATYLVTGVPTCSQLDHVDIIVGSDIVTNDITKWILTIIDNKIDSKYGKAEAYFMKLFSSQFVNLIVSRVDKTITKESLMMLRKIINLVIYEFSISVSIYGPLTLIFGMLDQ